MIKIPDVKIHWVERCSGHWRDKLNISGFDFKNEMVTSDSRNQIIYAEQQNRLLSYASLYVLPPQIHIDYVSTATDFKHKGLATTLLENVFTRAASFVPDFGSESYVTMHAFTDDGRAYLLPLIQQLQKLHKHVNLDFIPG